MPLRHWKQRIEDILDAVARIGRYVGGMSFEEFSLDEKTVDAVVRNITIIGEAARHVPADVQQRHPDVQWTEMRGIRNKVTHQYFGIDLVVLWDTIEDDLPSLVSRLQNMLDEET